MKIRSIRELLTEARAAFERFPWSLICGVTVALTMMFISRNSSDKPDLVRVAMIAALGITSFFSLRLYAEARSWPARRLNLWYLFLAGLLLAYYFLLPQKLKGFDLNRYALINLNLHLLAAVAPFLFLNGLSNAFWQYNKALFLRIFFAFIYSNTIFAGLAIAIGVTDNLFDVIKFHSNVYSDLWFVVIGVFNTWFFMGGVPKDILGLEGKTDYPKGLRIFTQFVLIPMVVLYIVILYLYMFKILMFWSLPKGWLSSFILGVSVSGITTLLLVHPLKDNEEFAWIRAYSRNFYLALYPLICLMAVAIGRRIMDYGITEQRYFILLFTVWLLIVATRFTLRPNADIRFIPLTLLVLTAAATWGPWSAMSVSKWNQTARLKALLTDEGLLVDGVLKKSGKTMDPKTVGEISNIVAYLEGNFGLKHLEKWAPSQKTASWSDLSASGFVTQELGLEYSPYYSRGLFSEGFHDASVNLSFHAKEDRVTDVSGYDYAVDINLYAHDDKNQPLTETFETPQGKLSVSLNFSTGEFWVFNGDNKVMPIIFSSQWLKELNQRFGLQSYNIPRDEMTFKAEHGALRCRLQVKNIGATIPEGKDAQPVLNHLSGIILFSLETMDSFETNPVNKETE